MEAMICREFRSANRCFVHSEAEALNAESGGVPVEMERCSVVRCNTCGLFLVEG